MLWKSFKRLKCLGLTSTSVPSEVGAHSCLKNSFQPHYLAHSFVGWSSPPKNTLFKKPAFDALSMCIVHRGGNCKTFECARLKRYIPNCSNNDYNAT